MSRNSYISHAFMGFDINQNVPSKWRIMNLDKRNTVLSGRAIFNFFPVLDLIIKCVQNFYVIDILELHQP